jgi:dTDP-4-dehydrorhamnose reductase
MGMQSLWKVVHSVKEEKRLMKIIILGATGMLGHKVADHMAKVYGERNIIRTSRSRWTSIDRKHRNAKDENWAELNIPHSCMSLAIPQDTDYVINCIGVIKPFIKSVGVVNTLQINSIFPHLLAEYCQKRNIKLIHITTDCVYSGAGLTAGQYIESDPHDATDLYGRSKSLGEPIETAMTLRTSIIGREIAKNASLVAWVQSQAGKTVNGYTNHFWNGITTQTYAECCQKIIDNDWYETGLFHIFSPAQVSKYTLVQMISDRLGLGVTVNPTEADPSCDRTLSTDFDLCSNLQIPYLSEQMKGL